MSKQINAVRRGRPVKPLNLPATPKMTVNDIWAINPHIECRLSVYTKVDKLVKTRILRRTNETVPSSHSHEVGKPLDVYQTMTSFRRSRAAKKAARTVKQQKSNPLLAAIAEIPVVNLNPNAVTEPVTIS